MYLCPGTNLRDGSMAGHGAVVQPDGENVHRKDERHVAEAGRSRRLLLDRDARCRGACSVRHLLAGASGKGGVEEDHALRS
eukprot:1006019-Rhodomonas_salina.1